MLVVTQLLVTLTNPSRYCHDNLLPWQLEHHRRLDQTFVDWHHTARETCFKLELRQACHRLYKAVIESMFLQDLVNQ